MASSAHPLLPSGITAALLSRAEKFCGEPFLLPGEDACALAPDCARRRALDAALAELEAGARSASPAWRQRYALMLGLERVLACDQPRLSDGTLLSAHQVDVLSGTLAALISEIQGSECAALAQDDEEASTEEPLDWDASEEDQLDEQIAEDPGAARRFWFEHATGSGKSVAALGFIAAARAAGVLILTHRRNLVDQLIGELRDRGYGDRLCPPLAPGEDGPEAPVTIETYQWFVRNEGQVSDHYAVVICDEAHTALGEKTSACIRALEGPVFIGMTATGALIERHVADLFPTQTSRFDLGQAARRGVICPLRCLRIPPGVGVRSIGKVTLRRGEVDCEFDQEELAALLDHDPFNFAVAALYAERFAGLPGVVYAAGVKHAYRLAEAFRAAGIKTQAVSGETPKRELARILAAYERGEIDVLCNAQLLAEGWNSPRATVCLHLAPTASKRIYQQRVGRVTRRHPGKEAGIVVDFVHPGTTHDDPVVTLHSLLEREIYRSGAVVVGPVRHRGRRLLRVADRIVPLAPDPEHRAELFARELWRIDVPSLTDSERAVWAELAGARCGPDRMDHVLSLLGEDEELRRAFCLSAVIRSNERSVRLRALAQLARCGTDDEIERAIRELSGWKADERERGARCILGALGERRELEREQVIAWIWELGQAGARRHEQYLLERCPEASRLLGRLVNSRGQVHAAAARELIAYARTLEKPLAAALLAAAPAHTPHAESLLRGARRKLCGKSPSSLALLLAENLPGERSNKKRRRRRKRKSAVAEPVLAAVEAAAGAVEAAAGAVLPDTPEPEPALA